VRGSHLLDLRCEVSGLSCSSSIIIIIIIIIIVATLCWPHQWHGAHVRSVERAIGIPRSTERIDTVTELGFRVGGVGLRGNPMAAVA
jgi:hypothetical protein